jgi:hypothetical protein
MLDSYISMLYHHRLIKVKAKKTSTYRPIQSKSPATTYSTTRPPRRPLTTAAAPFVPPVRPAYSDEDIDSGGRRGNRDQWTGQTEYKAFSPVVRIGTPPTPSPAGECVPTIWFRGRDTLACGRGGGGTHFGRGDIHCGTLGTYVLCGPTVCLLSSFICSTASS